MNNNLLDSPSAFLSEKIIRALYIWAAILLTGVLITGFFNLYNAYLDIKSYPGFASDMPVRMKTQISGNIALSILYGILLPIQTIFFYRFVQICKRSQSNGQAFHLDQSFRWLVRQTIVASIFFLINAAWQIVCSLILKT